MRLIGLVTFMPVNLQLDSEGINGCFTEVLLTHPPILGGLPVTCHLCLQGANSTHRLQVFKGHLHSKALFLEKVRGFLKMSLAFK